MVALFVTNVELKKTLTLKSQMVQLFWVGDCSVKLPVGCHDASLTFICFLLALLIFRGCVRYIFASLFLSLKDSTCETRKNVFYFTVKALFVLEKIKF